MNIAYDSVRLEKKRSYGIPICNHILRSGQIIVTHEIVFAKEIADEIAFIDEGKVLEKGPPDEILSNPSHSRTREFLRTVIEKR